MQQNRAQKIVEFFGSRTEMAKTLGVSRAAVTQWFLEGLPPGRAVEIERLSGGELKAVDIAGATIYE